MFRLRHPPFRSSSLRLSSDRRVVPRDVVRISGRSASAANVLAGRDLHLVTFLDRSRCIMASIGFCTEIAPSWEPGSTPYWFAQAATRPCFDDQGQSAAALDCEVLCGIGWVSGGLSILAKAGVLDGFPMYHSLGPFPFVRCVS